MKLLIFFTILFIAYIVLDIVFDDSLWKFNTTFTEDMQNNQFNGEKFIFQILTLLIYIPPAIVGIFYLFHYRKLNSLLYLGNVIIVFVLNGTLKNIYSQARPYWTEDTIDSYACNKEFGKPSGHAQSSIVFLFGFMFFFCDSLFHNNNKKNVVDSSIQEKISIYENQEQDNNRRSLMKYVTIILITILVLLIGLSRIFLGVHSVGQVLLGYVYGSYHLYIYIFFMHSKIKRYLRQELKGTHSNKFKKAAYLTSIIFIILTIINIIALELSMRNKFNQNYTLWLTQIDKCDDKPVGYYTVNDKNILYNPCFIQYTLFLGIVAFCQGCFFGQGSFNNTEFQYSYKMLSTSQKVYRFCLYIPATFLGPLYFINYGFIYYDVLFSIVPICIYVGIYLSYIYQCLIAYFNLSIQGDFLLPNKMEYEQLLDV